MSFTSQLWLLFLLPWLTSLVVVILLSLLNVSGFTQLGNWLFLSSAGLMGMAHGAYDIQLSRTRAAKISPLFLFGYMVLFAVVLLSWELVPTVTMATFLVISGLHWGIADFSFDTITPAQRWLLGTSRGVLIFSSLYYFSPNEVDHILTSMTGSTDLGRLMATISPYGLVLGILCQITGLGLLTKNRRSIARLHLLETVWIVLIFAILPVYAALFVYFVLFHSYRHLMRIAAYEIAGALSSLRSGWRQLVRLHRETSAVCLFCLVGGIIWALTSAPPSTVHFSETYLKLLSAFTLPHAIWIARLDYTITSEKWFLPLPPITSALNSSTT